MTDDTEFKKGDLIFYTKNTGETSWLIFDKKIISNNPAWNYIYYIQNSDGKTDDFIANRDYEKSMGKATKEEIIQHFTKDKQMNKQELVPFTIYGKNNLLQAIHEDLKELGYIFDSELRKDHKSILQWSDKLESIIKDKKEKILYPSNSVLNSSHYKCFNLPKDYQAALDYAKEFFDYFQTKEIIINDYKAEFSKGQVKFGCKAITKGQIQGLISTLELTEQLGAFDISDKGIDNENFGGLTVDKKLLQTILEKI